MHVRGDAVARRAAVEHEHAPPRPHEHERRAEPALPPPTMMTSHDSSCMPTMLAVALQRSWQHGVAETAKGGARCPTTSTRCSTASRRGCATSRQRADYTLAELAGETGISTQHPVAAGVGLRRPTLDLLIRLAGAYRASLDDLVGAPQIADPRVHPEAVLPQRPGDHPADAATTPTCTPSRWCCRGIRPTQPVEQRAHEGYDWIYVLSGRVRLALGDDEIMLEAGEAAEFDTRVPHGHASASTEPAEILNLLSTQGERVHVRSA